ncbi:MAG: hypothetical protein N2202_03450 [Proteobacteria bacterium]|nr:hypothetical protein [Pseudomonadota bacterium]
MNKKIICLFLMFFFFFSMNNVAFSRELTRRGTSGEVIFTDAIYGAAIGALVGAALVAIDSDDAGSKIGGGVLVGTLLGVAYGLHETKSFAEYRDGKLALNVPQLTLEKEHNNIVYKLPLFKAEFK